MWSRIISVVKKRHVKLLLIISAIFFVFDLFFVYINYYSDSKKLNKDLIHHAREHQRDFDFSLQIIYRNMMQLAQVISSNEELNQLFLQGKKAIEHEGGGAGKITAAKARQKLLKKVNPAWAKLSGNFGVKQLQYHLGSGSLSFLRVHAPDKYGDRMDDLRHIIVDTNADHQPRSGLEIGRVSTGLRSVSPIWAIDPATNKKVYVGALETGTSIENLLPTWNNYFCSNLAILLSKSVVKKKHGINILNIFSLTTKILNFMLKQQRPKISIVLFPPYPFLITI